jgi:hypothetical protein
MQFFETIASLFTIKCLNYAVFLLNFKFYLLQKQKTGALSSCFILALINHLILQY